MCYMATCMYASELGISSKGSDSIVTQAEHDTVILCALSHLIVTQTERRGGTVSSMESEQHCGRSVSQSDRTHAVN